MKKFVIVMLAAVMLLVVCAGCEAEYDGIKADIETTMENASKIQQNQPTPTDIDYSLERYNLIRRAYWVNGQREKAMSVTCPLDKPLGYIVLFTDNGSVVNKFIVDGKVSSLNSFLTPDSEYYEQHNSDNGKSILVSNNEWLADVDGSYGENDNGIFFFTPDGKYVEWTGTYLYSDIPFEIDDPVVKIGG